MTDERGALSLVLERISQTGAEITLTLSDRELATEDDNRSDSTNSSDRSSVGGYTSRASHILRAIDFAGTPVRGLDFGFANIDDGLDEDWPSHPACKSLCGLKSLKFGIVEEEEEDWEDGQYNGQQGGLMAYRIMGDRDAFELGGVRAVLGAAVDLQELCVSMIRSDAYRGAVSFSQRLLKTLGAHASHLKLRKLHLDKQCDHEGIMNFAAQFRDTLTYLSLSNVTAVYAGAWPKALRFLANFPALQQVSILRLWYACLGLFNEQRFRLSKCTRQVVDINHDVAAGLKDLAAKVELDIIAYGDSESEESDASRDEDDQDGDSEYWDSESEDFDDDGGYAAMDVDY